MNGMAGISAFDRLPRAVVDWAERRCLSAATLIGMALAAAACAVIWYSAGTAVGSLAGGLLLGGGYLLFLVSRQPVTSYGWKAACLAVEAAAYAGIAAGVRGSGRSDVWCLAAGALILLVVRAAAALDGASARLAAGPLPWLLSFPLSGRILLIMTVAPVLGARATLTGLLACGTGALVAAIVPAVRAGLRGSGALGTGGAARNGRPGRPVALVAARGDGIAARAVGRLARGQVPPLLPALAGLVGTAMLAVVGMSGLPGPLMLAPVAIMMLAAPGAGSPHEGRLDWLAPPALCAGESLYLVALGFGTGVPAPLTFALICVLSLRRLATMERVGARLGWEGRMLLLGLAAVAGFSAFAYLALTAYLGVLLVWAGLTGWIGARQAHLLAAAEGEGQ